MPGTTRKHVIAAVSAVVAAALMLSFGYYAGRRINRDEYAVFYTSHADEETVRSLPGLVSLPGLIILSGSLGRVRGWAGISGARLLSSVRKSGPVAQFC